jgi:hypothetical protein
MENVLFENKYEVTPALMKKWNSLSFKRSAKHKVWVSLAMKIGFALLTVLFLVQGIFTGDDIYYYLAMIYGVASVMLIFMPGYRKRYKNYLKFSGQTEWIQRLQFGEKIEAASGNTVTTFTYDQINYIDENEDCFFLWLNVSTTLIVYKNAFVVGDADLFRAFIYEKCMEYKSLWTKKKHNHTSIKKQIPRIIILVILSCFVLLSAYQTGGYVTGYYRNKERAADYNIDVIYFAHWAVFRTQKETDAYKIDLKNKDFCYIGSDAALSKKDWGSEYGDRDFQFISDIDDNAIGKFFSQIAEHGFSDWKERYVDNSILDGSEWYIKIVYTDGKVKEMTGMNKYPETWKNVVADFQNLTGYIFK